MKLKNYVLLTLLLTGIVAAIFSGCVRKKTSELKDPLKISDETLPTPQIPFDPRRYICYRTDQPLKIDGKLSEQRWDSAPWTEEFVDIEGSLKPAPRFNTRAKMLWDDKYFYVAAEMEEPDVWAKLTERDAVIYHDNDFEVFIDPDGDSHEYYELEVNTFNTQWDLLLLKPYRDGGPAVNAWDIQGLKTAVHIFGTINKPGDTDKGWSIEIAFPWAVLKECAHRPTPPTNGEQWRVNFSRVEWEVETVNGNYVKKTDPATSQSLPENNWVWTPQGLIAMHYPERWGYVQFSDKITGEGTDTIIPDKTENARQALYELYYAQRTYKMQYDTFTDDLKKLHLKKPKLTGYTWPPVMETTRDLFKACLEESDGREKVCITHDGKLTKEK
ncbi:MAG: carbohydrate-binding family 9-like protein [Candidatus Zixiibacteriota bacterium]